MTTSYTRSATFTITDARYIASKLGADLRNLNSRYGSPDLARIDDFVEEAAQYLKAGYLDTVDFGFKDGDRWILRLRYKAVAGELEDSAPGGLPNIDVSTYSFYSFLTTNNAYGLLNEAERGAFESSLPITRTPGTAPSTNSGSHGNNTSYFRNGTGLTRDVYRAI